MIATISLTVNAVATTAIHRALKNPAVAKIISSHNEAGYNDMVTVVLTPGYYTADGADEFVALTTDELNATLAGVITDPPPSPCGDPECDDGWIPGDYRISRHGDVEETAHPCSVCQPNYRDYDEADLEPELWDQSCYA